MKKPGFIYIWYDKKRKKYYLGSHLGLPGDGYTGSNLRFQTAYKSRPETFKRRILESHSFITPKELLQREQAWLDMIDPEELNNRYYNEKKLATGGNIYQYLSEEKKKEHAIKTGESSKRYWNSLSEEQKKDRTKNAFGGNKFDRSYMKKRQHDLLSKEAEIVCPDGQKKIIKNISDFCKQNGLNPGNFKSMLRGDPRRKVCGGFTGRYL